MLSGTELRVKNTTFQGNLAGAGATFSLQYRASVYLTCNSQVARYMIFNFDRVV